MSRGLLSIRGICELGFSGAYTARNPGYFRFVCKKTAHFANACITALAAGLGLCADVAAAAHQAPTMLRVEYLVNPLGIDTSAPRFSWWMQHSENNQAQTAYQVQVATSPALLDQNRPDLWDSGKTPGDRSVHVEYAGQPLQSSTRYYWRVRLWDRANRPSPFSDTAHFETALLRDSDFLAAWVTGIEDLENANGYHSEFFESPDQHQWVRIDLQEPREIAAVVLYPARPFDWKRDEPGFGFPVRYTVSLSNAPSGIGATIIADRSGEDQPNPGASPVRLEFPPQKARFVIMDVQKLAGNGEGQYMLALAELEVLNAAGENFALNKPVEVASRIENDTWSRSRLVDGIRVSQQGRRVSPLMRKAFLLDKPVRSARAYVSGLGHYELYLNGRRVGDHVLDPGQTVYRKRTHYVTHDVTELLQPGENVAGMMIGHGWWPETCAAWLQLRIEYADGTTNTIVTNDTWRWATGPIIEERLYHGEVYDARLERTGWNTPGYDDADWEPVRLMATPPAKLSAQVMPPIRVVQTIRPITLTPLENGGIVVDFGQNISGWVRLSVTGPAGAEVTVRHAELRYPDGRLNQENLRSARATDTYILKGAGVETYEPRFNHHGFRYAEVIGYPGELSPDKIAARVVHTDFQRSGAFECSSALYNKIRDISLWSIRANNMSIPTDCPQRDERMGWMGDAHLAAEATILNFDVAAYYQNFLQIIADSQSEEGFIPDTAPHFWGQLDGSPPWAIAYPLIAWYSWRYYENRRAVEEHYDPIVRWFRTMEAKAQDHILEYCHYGDWVGVEPTPMPPIGTGCYYWTAAILEEFARVLGKEADRAMFAQRKQDIAAAYNARFFNAEKGYYDEGSQFSQIWPIYLGIAGEHRDAALRRLLHEIMETRQGHLATGILGTKYVFPVLMDSGNADVAYTVSLQEDYPSWGYMIANGATTLWELWKLETGPGMNSHNHQMFGSIVDWFFGYVAGLRTLPEPGYQRFTIAPAVAGPLDHASAHVDSVRGRAASSWRKTDGGYDLEVDIPPNAAAKLILPKLGGAIKEAPKGIVPVDDGPDAVTYELGSGKYAFSVR